MAKILTDLDDAITYLNTLYEVDSTDPGSTDEDYAVWTSLFNVGINLWEMEEGVLWNELFTKLSAASDGDKTTDGTNSYDLPTDFKFSASGYVWLGTGTNKTAYKVVKQEELTMYENQRGSWCYFTTLTLEFGPNTSIDSGSTIVYNYYKEASKVSSGSDTFEMADPMFCVYYALSELKKEEGDTTSAIIATQKLEGMKTRNIMPTWFQEDAMDKLDDDGFGI